MPELTIAMPARNAARFLREAMDSVLTQEGVDVELVVVDDASTDETAAIAEAAADPRVRVLRNETRRGIAGCHNRVLRESTAPYIAHVDADDIVRPGALKRMVEALRDDRHIGQVHCYDVDVDETGHVSREDFQRRMASYRNHRQPGMDYRAQLVERGCVVNHLRTYRREALDEAGPFNEALAIGEDWEMALRLLDRWEIRLVPEVLYLHRLHGANSVERSFSNSVRVLHMQYRICRDLAAQGRPAYLAARKKELRAIFWRRFKGVLHDRFAWRWWVERKRRARRLARMTAARLHLVFDSVYATTVRCFRWWPLAWWPFRRKPVRGPRRVAYFNWQFPVLSQTFIQRETEALLEAGCDIDILSFAPEDVPWLDERGRALMARTHYLDLEDRSHLLRTAAWCCLRHPLRTLNLFLYVVFHRHGEKKNPREDLKVFGLALFLAGVLRARGARHLHAPWANRCAFVAVVAARWLNIPCTVQARAYDVHRHDGLHALPELLKRVDGVLTNSRYNEAYLRGFLPGRAADKVRLQYNGVDFHRFHPPAAPPPWDGRIELLCVARLTEQKGLPHLLRACALLKARGRDLRCTIIGARVDPDATRCYVRLRLLQRELGLVDDVVFAGARPLPEVMEAYARSHLFVLPAVVAEDGSRDITPNALIEAMAMTLPVVSTRLVAIPEIVEDGVSGLLVAPGDAEGLAVAMEALMDDPARARRLGLAAREKVLGQFDVRRNVQGFMRFFEETA